MRKTRLLKHFLLLFALIAGSTSTWAQTTVTLTQSALELRNSILDYTKGKTELESMDDELPLCMYLVTQIKVSNFLAELNLVQDYLQYSLRDKMIQNKVVTNLISSALYIMDSW